MFDNELTLVPSLRFLHKAAFMGDGKNGVLVGGSWIAPEFKFTGYFSLGNVHSWRIAHFRVYAFVLFC